MKTNPISAIDVVSSSWLKYSLNAMGERMDGAAEGRKEWTTKVHQKWLPIWVTRGNSSSAWCTLAQRSGTGTVSVPTISMALWSLRCVFLHAVHVISVSAWFNLDCRMSSSQLSTQRNSLFCSWERLSIQVYMTNIIWLSTRSHTAFSSIVPSSTVQNTAA